MARERHSRVPGVSVSGSVSDCFLRDSKQRQCHGRRFRLDFTISDEPDLHVVLSLRFGAVCFERGDQPDVLQHARMKIVREQAKGFGDSADPRMDGGQNLLNRGVA